MMDKKRPQSSTSNPHSQSTPHLSQPARKPGAKVNPNFSSASEDPNQAPDLKEYVHELKLKGAISRQELAKAQRENQQLQEEIKQLEEETKKLEKTLASDERYLQRQEEELSVLRAAIVPNPEALNRRIEELTREIEASKECVSDLKRSQEREISLCVEAKNEQMRLKELLTAGNIPEALTLMKHQISIYEEQLSCKEKASKLVEERYQKHLELVDKEKNDLQQELEQVKSARVNDQRTLYDLERRVAYLESDAKLTTVSEEAKTTEKVAIQAAETVLGKLKEKLKATDESQPFLETIARQVNKNKSRTINLL